MLHYAKFLNDLFTNKIKIEQSEVVMLDASYLVVLQENMPSKMKDLGSFIIPSILETWLKRSYWKIPGPVLM